MDQPAAVVLAVVECYQVPVGPDCGDCDMGHLCLHHRAIATPEGHSCLLEVVSQSAAAVSAAVDVHKVLAERHCGQSTGCQGMGCHVSAGYLVVSLDQGSGSSG